VRWQDKDNKWLWRETIPLPLAWALTIHKSKGKKMYRFVGHLGDKEYCIGMALVALSRVRDLRDLLIEGWIVSSRSTRASQSKSLLAGQGQQVAVTLDYPQK
jgi:hypothetical protein